MATREVFPDEEFTDGNPHTALIGSDEDFNSGLIRIEPPLVDVSKEYFHMLETAAGVELEHQISSSVATALGFRMGEGSHTGPWTDEERVVITTQTMLNDLGRLANADLFHKDYNRNGA